MDMPRMVRMVRTKCLKCDCENFCDVVVKESLPKDNEHNEGRVITWKLEPELVMCTNCGLVRGKHKS